MSEHAVSQRLALAEKVAREGGEKAFDYCLRRDSLVIETKRDAQDVVSIADREVELFIRATIARDFPEDGFLGEEFGLQPGTSGYTWVVDPIDGTSPFVHGIPNWCVSVAVVHGNDTVIGAIYCPNQQEIFLAAKGQGATLNGRKLQVDPTRTMQNHLTGIGSNSHVTPQRVGEIVSDVLARGGNFFRNGSGAMMLAYVACGRLVGYYEPRMNAWDCLAGFCLVQEAGGWTYPYDVEGDKLLHGGIVLAAAPGAKADLLGVAGL